jgi:hypothetical protein
MFEVYVVMQKRGGGKVYCDLHKTDGKFHFTPEEAEDELTTKGELAKHFHVVKVLVGLPEEWEN